MEEIQSKSFKYNKEDYMLLHSMQTSAYMDIILWLNGNINISTYSTVSSKEGITVFYTINSYK